MPPRIAPPRTRVGGSPPITITSAPLSRASWTIPDPIERARTKLVVTSTFSYSSPTSRARSSARSARSRTAFGSGESSGTVSGSSAT